MLAWYFLYLPPRLVVRFFRLMQLTPEIQEEINQVRQNCGYFFMEGWSILSAKGEDTLDFLQTQTTNDALQLQVGQGQSSAITDRQARLITSFSLHRMDENESWLLSDNSKTLQDQLESYHFREAVAFDVLNLDLLALQGPKSMLVLEKIFSSLPEKPNGIERHDVEG
ncbi:MAG: glycine cleavage system aminomethyltransferase T, partial [Nitrospinales bacterium]